MKGVFYKAMYGFVVFNLAEKNIMILPLHPFSFSIVFVVFQQLLNYPIPDIETLRQSRDIKKFFRYKKLNLFFLVLLTYCTLGLLFIFLLSHLLSYRSCQK